MYRKELEFPKLARTINKAQESLLIFLYYFCVMETDSVIIKNLDKFPRPDFILLVLSIVHWP